MWSGSIPESTIATVTAGSPRNPSRQAAGARIRRMFHWIGKKKAERIILELTDRLDDLPAAAAVPQPAADAVRALVHLGYASAVAETAVRNATQGGAPDNTAALIRRALADLGRK